MAPPLGDARLLSLLGSSSRPPDSDRHLPSLLQEDSGAADPWLTFTVVPRWGALTLSWGPPSACQLLLGLGHTKDPLSVLTRPSPGNQVAMA